MKYLFLIFTIFLISGCYGVKTEYIYKNVFIKENIPYIDTIERPNLYQVSISVYDSDDGFLDEVKLSPSDIDKIFVNQMNLIDTIKAYEHKIIIYQQFYKKYNSN